jgi:hypothetical protein
MTNYEDIYAEKLAGYRRGQVKPYSHYYEPIEQDGGLHGNSRIVGDASYSVQKVVIDLIICGAESYGMTDHQVALLLSIVRVESGFNPDAASNESASGISQMLDGTAKIYGINDTNRWDVSVQVDASIRLFLDLDKIVQKKNLPDEYVYKFWHDGPGSGLAQTGTGWDTAVNKVIPFMSKTMDFVGSYVYSTALVGSFIDKNGNIVLFDSYGANIVGSGGDMTIGFYEHAYIDINSGSVSVCHFDGSVETYDPVSKLIILRNIDGSGYMDRGDGVRINYGPGRINSSDDGSLIINGVKYFKTTSYFESENNTDLLASTWLSYDPIFSINSENFLDYSDTNYITGINLDGYDGVNFATGNVNIANGITSGNWSPGSWQPWSASV